MLYRACTQTIILVVRKITCGKKGQEKKIFQWYVIQGVGMFNVMIIMMIYRDLCHFALKVNFVIQQ